MRSNGSAGGEQEALWDAHDLQPEHVPVRSAARASRGPRVTVAPDRGWQPGDATLVLSDNSFARSGWPHGTVLHLSPASRAARGEFVVVRDSGRTKVGRFGLDRGRPALISDAGTLWLSEAAQVVATVSMVEAPFAM